jgi:hypothetical protein
MELSNRVTAEGKEESTETSPCSLRLASVNSVRTHCLPSNS